MSYHSLRDAFISGYKSARSRRLLTDSATPSKEIKEKYNKSYSKDSRVIGLIEKLEPYCFHRGKVYSIFDARARLSTEEVEVIEELEEGRYLDIKMMGPEDSSHLRVVLYRRGLRLFEEVLGVRGE